MSRKNNWYVKKEYFVNIKYIMWGYQWDVSILFDTLYLTAENVVSDIFEATV